MNQLAPNRGSAKMSNSAKMSRTAFLNSLRLGMSALCLLVAGGIVLGRISLLGQGDRENRAQGAEPQMATARPWMPLFNGRDLAGWTPKIKGYPLGENFGKTFRVEDGLLKVGYDAYDQFQDRFGHLFYKEPFSNYRLRLEYRFVGDQVKGGPAWAVRNSGVMIHGEAPELMDLDQDFPASIEVQLLGGPGTGQRPTANLCTPGTNVVMDGKLITRHCTNSKSQTYHGDQWVTVEIEVRGSQVVKHLIDGQVVLEYNQPQLDPNDAHAKKLIDKRQGQLLLEGGTISLQSESHPVEFRKVEIQQLD